MARPSSVSSAESDWRPLTPDQGHPSLSILPPESYWLTAAIKPATASTSMKAICVLPHVPTKRARWSVPSAAITGSTHFEANWNPNGEMFLKVNNKLVGKEQAGILHHEPGDSIQIGADLIQPVGDYDTPNYFSGTIENLTFKYPNGT